MRTFKLDEVLADGIAYPTYYDGMIVYNSASGTTCGNTLTTQTTITLGFYYFYNSNGATNGNITSGVWRPMTAAAVNPIVDVKTTETVTNTLIDTKQVYAIKGAFTADGLRTDVDILSPAGMTSLYGITIYQAGTKKVYARDLYEYNISTTATAPTKNAITDSPRISVVYPAGNYEYVLEYLK